ncbi:hypothetical protein MJM99_29100, partial [Salmonella enterica subsp. enterica serovar Kentucky]|nr:hypothetical protein [Salmonella enterica subsp. enterica serovar Kentucky]
TELKCGEVGWLVCAIKDILGAPVGDTLTSARNPAEKALPGFKTIFRQHAIFTQIHARVLTLALGFIKNERGGDGNVQRLYHTDHR